jgi:hypothetical protein
MSTEFTPWFTIETNGTPTREGVYETTSLGIPGESHSVLQHGFRHWGEEMKWGDLGSTPDGALSLKDHRPVFPFTVRHWRGKTVPPV